jgi:hypothetical protein
MDISCVVDAVGALLWVETYFPRRLPRRVMVQVEMCRSSSSSVRRSQNSSSPNLP